jgi:hypothetical protein
MKHLLCLLMLGYAAAAHESPIDHVDRRLAFTVSGDTLELRYRFRQTQRAALLQLRAMDANNNGRINAAERERFFKQTGERLAGRLKLKAAGSEMTFRTTDAVVLRPDFSQEFRLTVPLNRAVTVTFHDEFSGQYPGSVVIEQPPVEGRKVLLQIKQSPTMKVSRGHGGMTVLEIKILRNE